MSAKFLLITTLLSWVFLYFYLAGMGMLPSWLQ